MPLKKARSGNPTQSHQPLISGNPWENSSLDLKHGKKTPGTKPEKLPKSKDIFDSVTPGDAMTILKNLAREDPGFGRK